MNRTPGEKQRDLTISVMLKKLDLMKLQIRKMEELSCCNKEYNHANNYIKIISLIDDIRTDALNG